MDVDILWPGEVPTPPVKIHWYEFLLDQNLLEKHLSEPSPDPTGTDLILEFLSVEANNVWKGVSDPDAPPVPPSCSSPGAPPVTPLTRKQLALKILALKVAASLNWNLDTFESKLTPTVQQKLLQDLVYMATDGAFSEPPEEIPSDLLQKPQVEYALILYHRWILRFPVKAALQAKLAKDKIIPRSPLKNEFTHIMNSSFDNILRMSEACRALSIRYLEEVLIYYEPVDGKEPKKINVPTMESFVHLTEDTDKRNHSWEAGDLFISQYELAMQIHFDLCYNYLFYAQHDLAKVHIIGCRENYTFLDNEVTRYGYGSITCDQVPWGKLKYASMSNDEMIGYIRALSLGYTLLNEEPSLLHKLQESVTNNYIGIIAVFQADNLAREIPMIHRQVVELDIQRSATKGFLIIARDLLIRVSVLNAVRYALEGGLPSTHPDFLKKLNKTGIKFFDFLFWAMAPVLTSNLSKKDWERLRMFFLHLLISSQHALPVDKIDWYLRKHVGDAAPLIREKLICDEHLQKILTDQLDADDDNMYLPPELLTDGWETPDLECETAPELEKGRLKKRLVESASAEEVRANLQKLAESSPSAGLWKLSPYWKPIGNAATALKALPNGFLRDFGYVLSALTRARMEAGQARAALALLTALESEALVRLANGENPALYRLSRLVAWELLMLEVNVMLAEWPNHRVDVAALANKCKECIAAAGAREGVHPRPQTVHAAWMCMLNIGEWESGAAPAGPGELAAALCAACARLRGSKRGRKLPRTLFDYVLSSLNSGMNGPTKRNIHVTQALGHYNNKYIHSNYHGQTAGRGAYHALLQALREPHATTVMLSVLAKIYNVLVEDSSLELNVEYTNVWPNIITNANAYNLKFILETMTELLDRSLKMYPYNTSWLRLYGDVEMATGRHGAALRRYLCALAVGSEYFARRAPDEGAIARRAARCCQALGASTQAMALCQLTDEPDYTNAFKYFAEKTETPVDAMDAYYVCLWDGTLLEVAAALHARRGEGGRRARAVSAAGALELNASNSEDIRRRAAAVRRARLLRALTNLYVT